MGFCICSAVSINLSFLLGWIHQLFLSQESTQVGYFSLNFCMCLSLANSFAKHKYMCTTLRLSGNSLNKLSTTSLGVSYVFVVIIMMSKGQVSPFIIGGLLTRPQKDGLLFGGVFKLGRMTGFLAIDEMFSLK